MSRGKAERLALAERAKARKQAARGIKARRLQREAAKGAQRMKATLS